MIAGIVVLSFDRLIFFVGVNTGYVINGEPDERLIDFYSCRSSPALHCAIVGNVVIPGGYGTNSNSPVISKSSRWNELATAISSRGSVPGIQLSTTWEDYIGPTNFRSRSGAEEIDRSREFVLNFGTGNTRKVLKNLMEASDVAVDAGFRHLQVHAAHGYLFNLLIDERINRNAQDIMCWLESWASSYAERGVETSIRISLRSGDTQYDSRGASEFLENVSILPFDFKDISSGFYGIDKRLIYPSRPDIIEERRADTVLLAGRFPDEKFIFSGKALSKPLHDLPHNVHLGVCRDLIANPSFLDEPAHGCTNSGKCHYYSRGEKHITCSQWEK